MRKRAFKTVDVFGKQPYFGNPLAVVLDGEGLSDEEMQGFARWTNLSETTFLLPPSSPQADYRVRIFTASQELPFAGHPTLGSCHAWLETEGASLPGASEIDVLSRDVSSSLEGGGKPKDSGHVVQECGVGLVTLRRTEDRLAFAAPQLLKTGPVDEPTLAEIAQALRVARGEILQHNWVDNGPGWVAVMLRSADAVLTLEPDYTAMGSLNIGVVGAYPGDSECQFEVRAFVPSLNVPEDPVTGSLNAGLGQWLMGAGLAPERYVVSQGTVLGRAGRVYLERDEAGQVWVGGRSVTCVEGTVNL